MTANNVSDNGGNSHHPQQQPSQQRKRKRNRQRLDPSTSTVVIVGAGLAGLSVALSLKRAGFGKIHLFERDVSLDHQKEGYGLTLTYNPKGPLADLGVLEKVAQRDCPSRSHYLFQQEEEEEEEEAPSSTTTNTKHHYALPMGYFGNAFFASPRGYGQRGNLRVPRKVLRKLLHDALLEKGNENENENEPTSTPTVHWNKSLVDFQWEASKQQYHVRFAETTPSTTTDAAASVNTTTVVADLLVAADGIRSAVLQQLYNQKLERETNNTNHNNTPMPIAKPMPSIREVPQRYGLRPMGIRLILGIAEGIDHPLLRERGFYTVDTKGHRLFTMPYRSDRFDNVKEEGDTSTKKNTKIMWQLSFSNPHDPKTLDAASLRKYVMRTFATWHPPVLDLVKATPPEGIWGTDLMDRDPYSVYQELIVGGKTTNGSQIAQPRLAVCGDALHSMSPFKGQGANQALADGPLLAKWLGKSSVDAALTNWWRETLNRTAPVVKASRKAARDWHDPTVILKHHQGQDDYHGFAGVDPSRRVALLQKLREENIGPHLGGTLDAAIRTVIAQHGWFDDKEEINSSNCHLVNLDPNLCQDVLALAATGNTQGLRQKSLPSAASGGNRRACWAMIRARDAQDRTCLHLAAIHNHLATCQWLLTELRILEQWKEQQEGNTDNGKDYCGPKDAFGKTAWEYAMETGNKTMTRLFEVILREQD